MYQVDYNSSGIKSHAHALVYVEAADTKTARKWFSDLHPLAHIFSVKKWREDATPRSRITRKIYNERMKKIRAEKKEGERLLREAKKHAAETRALREKVDKVLAKKTADKKVGKASMMLISRADLKKIRAKIQKLA